MSDDDLEGRVNRLEVEAEERHRLARGVEQLSTDVGDLNVILGKVDAQQQQLTDLTTRARTIELTATTAARHAEENAFTLDERVATVQIERQLFMRKLYRALAAAVAFAVLTVVGGAWLTDAHLQNCILQGPMSSTAKQLCDLTFPGHHHPPETSLAALLKQRDENQLNAVLAQRAGCERTQKRVNLQVLIHRSLAREDLRRRDFYANAARDLERTLIDCNKEYPLPKDGVVGRDGS